MFRKNMLRLKMLRDVRKNFAQFVTIFLMLTIGMMAYTGIRSYMRGMEVAGERYYAENNLQDLDAFGKFDEKSLTEIKKITHIKNAEGKLSVLAKVENLEKRDLQLNFIASNEIAKFYVVNGEKFDIERRGIWLDEYFAKNNNLKVGDTLKFNVNNIKLQEKIVGLVYTPDHVAYKKDETEIFPAHDKYGYAYLSQNILPENLRIYSSIMIDVDDEHNVDKVKSSITNKINNVVSVVRTKDQYSAVSYQGEINEGKTYVGIFSGMFIAIALLCVVTAMTRIIRKDRSQIGTLKALGFGNRRIIWHYVSYILLLTIIGVGTGFLLGYVWFGNFFIKMQMKYFEIAKYNTIIDWDVWLVMGLVIIATCLTCYLVVRSYVRQPAAEILRIERPNIKSRNLHFTTAKIFEKMSFAARWNLRDIIRNKARVATSVAGMIGCMVLLVCGFSIKDTMNNYIETELSVINNYKYRINISEKASPQMIDALTNIFSHSSSKTLPVEIIKNGSHKLNSILINDAGSLRQTLDQNWQITTVAEGGIMITKKLAEIEGFKLGEEVEWKILGEKTIYRTKIVKFSRDPQNQNITMSRKFYESLRRKYLPDAIYTNDKIDEKPAGASSVQSIDAIRDSMNTMLKTMNSMIVMLVGFAILLGIIIIYNMGVLSFAEKDYQFATLKVLGFSDRKISYMFIQQNVWLTVVAIIIGLPAGYAVTDFIFKHAIEENYDFGVFVTFNTCLISILGVLITTAVVSYWLARRVIKIDMIKSLKANE